MNIHQMLRARVQCLNCSHMNQELTLRLSQNLETNPLYRPFAKGENSFLSPFCKGGLRGILILRFIISLMLHHWRNIRMKRLFFTQLELTLTLESAKKICKSEYVFSENAIFATQANPDEQKIVISIGRY